MIAEWTEIVLLQKLKKKKRMEERREVVGERERERGKYGYLLRIVPVKYIKFLLFILINILKCRKKKNHHSSWESSVSVSLYF